MGDDRVQAGRGSGHLAHRPGRYDGGAQRAGLAVGAADDDRRPGPQAGASCDLGPDLPDDLVGLEHRREPLERDAQPVREVQRPRPSAQVECQCRGRVRAVRRELASQGQGDPVAWLKDVRGTAPRDRVVSAQPHQFGPHVERRRHMTGPLVDDRGTHSIPEPPRLRTRPVVAVDQAGCHGPEGAVEQHHRGALAGEADGQDPLSGREAPDHTRER